MDIQDRIDQLIERQRTPLIEGLLLVKDVVLYQPHSTPTFGVNSTFFVVFDGAHDAFHKPFAGVTAHAAVLYGQEPDSVPLNECAAWRLASRIGGLVAEIVAPCILRSISGSAGSLSARRVGHPHAAEPFLVAPDQCRAAAFFDSLIAQQDRHMGNYRWDPHDARLGLIDHGYAFAVPGWRFNASCFVQWRHDQDDAALNEWELASLEQFLHSGDIHGLAGVLSDEQAAALSRRAEHMRDRSEILNPGEW
ncbi:MAG: hypothetical protein ACREX8_09790 [Gammaproteobacteria bacterium]